MAAPAAVAVAELGRSTSHGPLGPGDKLQYHNGIDC